jgi:hypothetical protein
MTCSVLLGYGVDELLTEAPRHTLIMFLGSSMHTGRSVSSQELHHVLPADTSTSWVEAAYITSTD